MKTPLLILCACALALSGCATKQPKKPDTAPVAAGNANARESLGEARDATKDIRSDVELLKELTR